MAQGVDFEHQPCGGEDGVTLLPPTHTARMIIIIVYSQ